VIARRQRHGLKIICEPAHQPPQVLQVASAPLRKKYGRDSFSCCIDCSGHFFALSGDYGFPNPVVGFREMPAD
jgi:hypothetical protein